jgi:hypothetical protein
MKLTVLQRSLLAAACLLALAAPASANSFTSKADANAPPTRAVAHCASCEQPACAFQAPPRAETPGSARGIAKTKPDRCDVLLERGYFPTERDHIAAYLAKQQYPFE